MENIKPFLFQAKSLTSSSQNKFQILFLVIGFLLVAGSLLIKHQSTTNNSSIEIVSDESSNNAKETSDEKLVVDIRGAIEKPGVYYLEKDSRVEDVLLASGGLSENADTAWVDKNIIRSAKIIDGQKIYIPDKQSLSNDKQSEVLSATVSNENINVAQSENASNTGLININTASLSALDTLPGIGQVYGQKIIDHRPYSTLEELVSKGAIKQSTFEKIRDLITLF